MELKLSRITTCLDGVSSLATFASYASLSECVEDYALYLAYFRITPVERCDVVKFAEFLKRNKYCPSSDYVDRIFKIYNQFNS